MIRPSASQMTNRIQVRIGRLSINATHMSTPRIGRAAPSARETAVAVKDPFCAKNNHANADKTEREQRADIRQIGERTDVGEHGDATDHHAGPDRRDVRRAILRMNAVRNIAAAGHHGPWP